MLIVYHTIYYLDGGKYVYLDGGSRGAGTGTSNYVLFPGNEGLLQILERNGAPIR